MIFRWTTNRPRESANEMKTNERSNASNWNVEHVAQVISRLVQEIIMHPDNFERTIGMVGQTEVIYARVHRGDMPRLVGERGLHVQAITALVQLAGQRMGRSINFVLLEPATGEKDQHSRFSPQANWPMSRIRALVEDVALLVFRCPLDVMVSDGEGSMTSVEVMVSSRETGNVVLQGGAAMTALFNAVGKANGRLLRLAVVPEPEIETAAALVARRSKP
jgi:predicted RNA-binding protein YlqC (UPF0109 family)